MNLIVNNAQYSVLFTTRFDGKQHAILRVVYHQIHLKKNHSRNPNSSEVIQMEQSQIYSDSVQTFPSSTSSSSYSPSFPPSYLPSYASTPPTGSSPLGLVLRIFQHQILNQIDLLLFLLLFLARPSTS